MTKKINVCLVDDHKLFRKGMVELIDGFQEYNVIWEADNGKVFQRLIKTNAVPDIVLLDINMPELDGHATALWIKEHYPEIKILALSMYDDEISIIKMIRAGAGGYILKDADPSELRNAFDTLHRKGYYYSDLVSNALVNSIKKPFSESAEIVLTDREQEFIKLSCSELTYKEIADKMNLAPRTVDGYREALFEKLNVKSRVGLVMYAIRNKFMQA